VKAARDMDANKRKVNEDVDDSDCTDCDGDTEHCGRCRDRLGEGW
jgi:hypothetical protein